jgi:hypothetical protein
MSLDPNQPMNDAISEIEERYEIELMGLSGQEKLDAINEIAKQENSERSN